MATWKFGALGTRLAVTLIGVAFAVIAIFALVTLTIENNDVGRLAATQRAQTAKAVASVLDNAYRANGAWTGADLQPAVDLAGIAGAALALDAPDGSVLLRNGPEGLLGSADATQVRRALLVSRTLVRTEEDGNERRCRWDHGPSWQPLRQRSAMTLARAPLLWGVVTSKPSSEGVLARRLGELPGQDEASWPLGERLCGTLECIGCLW